MTRVFAFECYRDEDVFLFLKDQCQLPIRKFHAFGQGEVVNAVLVKQSADIGMVDEDPLSSHHTQRDVTQLVSTTDNLILRRRGTRYLFIVKPDLEKCFLRCVRMLNLRSKLPDRPDELRAALGVPNSAKHALFRQELAMLYAESRTKAVKTLLTELEEMIRSLLSQ